MTAATQDAAAADTTGEAEEQFLAAKRGRVSSMLGRGNTFKDDEADAILASPAGQQIRQMVPYTAVGTAAEISRYIEAFAEHSDADELITVHPAPTAEARLRSVELLADSVERGPEVAASTAAPSEESSGNEFERRRQDA